MRVPARVAAHSAVGGVLTPALRAPRRFDLVGARWRGGSATVWLRGRRVSGRWSRWARLSPSEESTGGRRSTEPVWAGGDDLVQLRSSSPLPGLRLEFVNASVPRARAARVQRVQLPTGPGLSIEPRAAWGASRCRPRRFTGYGRVDLAFVHHTETLGSYSRSRSASVVLGICLFHRDVNHWNDIGYNFLVDRFGQVFEGRAGGIEEPAIGAQAGGFNTFSTGVAAIGDFRFRRFSAAGMSALARLLAWRLSLSGVPAEGTVTVRSHGGRSTPFPNGRPVTLNRIAGHRDADSTACPGNALYAQLPALRRRVARLEGPVSQLELSAPQTGLPYGQPLGFSGRLIPASGATLPPGAAVAIQDQLASGGRTLALLPLAPDGSFSGSLPATRHDTIQASFAGGGGLPRLISTPVPVSVASSSSLHASASSPRVGPASPKRQRPGRNRLQFSPSARIVP
jgi:N-acetylmuramoyl-L-alanine amidase